MKNLALSTLFLFISLGLFAQNAATTESNVNNFNSFQDTKDRNPDSALYFLHKIAITNPATVEDLMHNSFAQSFIAFDGSSILADPEAVAYFKKINVTIDSLKRKFQSNKIQAYILLGKLSLDTNQLIRRNAVPIVKWVEAQDNANDTKKLLEISKTYIQLLSNNDDFYAERKARYGLMIVDILAKHPQLKTQSNELLRLIYDNLQNHQITENPKGLYGELRIKRSWYRFLYAYANFLSAQQSQSQTQKTAFLKIAADYSPDTADKEVKHAYFYDVVIMVGKEGRSFEADYLSTLDDGEEKFKKLVEMSMDDPSFKAQAKARFKQPDNFQQYWLAAFNKKFEPAPLFALTQLNGKEYKLADIKNQWTLIDFWGTWCKPCRAEHPALEQFYKQTAAAKNPNLNIITIASRDNEQAVRAYIKEFNYTFPVVMSDNKVEADYNVQGWPSKYLVSPQGNYVVIPFGVDWVKYIQEYIN